MAAEYRTTPPDTDKMPAGIPYIIGNEAAERFSYYGMRAILVVFLYQYLHLMSDRPEMSNAEAQEYYHTFSSWVYFFPILGAIISDAFTGKYRIILGVSVLYCLGHLSLACMGLSLLDPTTWMWLGLFLIALGSGGIKPCVSAHVGDQFGHRNQHLMAKVYQWFYFSINFGAILSTLLTPWLLEWYGPHIAFGVPGVLMALATFMFWMGRHVYIHVPPAGAQFLKEVFSWDGIRTILRLALVYACITMFWALFDQTSSVWVLQAEDMNRNWLGMEWLPSQLQALNPFLVMALIPLFQYVVYPAVERVFTLTSLRKISIGLFLTVLGFGLSAYVQQWIDHGYQPSIAWQFIAYVIITAAEVMVSITGLEFSYAQAPKSMKSVIMSVWLFSVSMGNIVTAMVNHSIQIPGINDVIGQTKTLVEVPTEGRRVKDHWMVRTTHLVAKENWEEFGEGVPVSEILVAGHDQKFDTDDDTRLQFDRFMSLISLDTRENAGLLEAKERIDEHFKASAKSAADMALPSDEVGQSLIAELHDTQGQPYEYHRITRDRYRIVAAGADGQFLTFDDVILKATIQRANPNANQQAKARPYNWRERRLIELKGEKGRLEVEAGRGQGPETKISGDITVGGQVTLEGAAYFWFWTYWMLGSAVLFVPISYFYRGQTHMQDTPDDDVPPGEVAAVATGE